MGTGYHNPQFSCLILAVEVNLIAYSASTRKMTYGDGGQIVPLTGEKCVQNSKVHFSTEMKYNVRHLGFRIQDSGFRIYNSRFRVQDLGFMIYYSGFRVQGSGFRIWDSEFRVQDLKFRIQGSRFEI